MFVELNERFGRKERNEARRDHTQKTLESRVTRVTDCCAFRHIHGDVTPCVTLLLVQTREFSRLSFASEYKYNIQKKKNQRESETFSAFSTAYHRVTSLHVQVSD